MKGKKKTMKAAIMLLGAVAILGIVAACVSDWLVLDLFNKNPSDWTVVDNGMKGQMKYGKFEFRATVPLAKTSYTLIRYTDPWATHKAVCLGSDVSGRLHTEKVKIGGVWKRIKVADVKIEGILLAGGPKVWLVPSSDVDCVAQKMIKWDSRCTVGVSSTDCPYYFENNLI